MCLNVLTLLKFILSAIKFEANTPTPTVSTRQRLLHVLNHSTLYIMSLFPPEMATLYVSPHPDDFRSLLALIAAEFNLSSRPRIVIEDPPVSLNARSRPTLVLRTGEGDTVVSGSSAVAWYLASQGKRAGVDAKQQSQVWQWLSFADNELTPVSCAAVFPLLGMMEVNKTVC